MVTKIHSLGIPDSLTKIMVYPKTAIADSSVNTVSVSASGSAVLSTTKIYFSGNSLKVPSPGTDYFLASAGTSILSFGTNDYTIDFWLYFDGTSPNTEPFWGSSVGATGSVDMVYYEYANRGFGIYTDNVASDKCYGGASSIIKQAWFHLAYVRYGGASNMYKNGTAMSEVHTDGNINTSNVNIKNFQIGKSTTGWTSSTNMYFQNFRISGYARWTGNFTPPTRQ
jgi:hypothetical protein